MKTTLSILLYGLLLLFAVGCSGPEPSPQSDSDETASSQPEETDETEETEETTSSESEETTQVAREAGYKPIDDAYTPLDTYLRTHPCISGAWEALEETEDAWVGVVHYPSDNTASDTLYASQPLRVKKVDGVTGMRKTDESGGPGQLYVILEKPTPDTALDKEQKDIRFRLIAVGRGEGGGTLHFLFTEHPSLKYKTPR